MALESGTYISDLNPSNPVGATDKVSTLDDHVRLLKSTIQATFPNIAGAVTLTHTELNYLDGITGVTGTGKVVLDNTPTIDKLTVTSSITLPAASIADAALSDNVPRKNAPNTFTAPLTISANNQWLYFREADAGENEKLSRIQGANGGLIWATRTDADGTGETWLSVQRNGVEVTEIELNGDALDFNGNADISGTLAVGGTITGNGSGLTSLNASNLSSGTVPDARLSSNVPLKNASNTFTGNTPIIARSGAPRFVSFVDGVAEDQGGWLYGGSAQGGNFRFLIATTADSEPSTAVNEAFVIRRNGTNVTEVELNADALDFNGNADISGSLTVGGARIAGEGGVIYHDSTNNLGGKIVLSSSAATTAGQVGAAGDMRFVYS